jgi:hypothetical protein
VLNVFNAILSPPKEPRDQAEQFLNELAETNPTNLIEFCLTTIELPDINPAVSASFPT